MNRRIEQIADELEPVMRSRRLALAAAKIVAAEYRLQARQFPGHAQSPNPPLTPSPQR